LKLLGLGLLQHRQDTHVSKLAQLVDGKAGALLIA
jgi:hypothetical protein